MNNYKNMNLFKICSTIALLITSLSANSFECEMAESFKQPDGNSKTGFTSVWSDKKSSSLLFVESLNVNTDGTKRSYNVDDFWGERIALNNLCNAMSDACAGLSNNEKKSRRINTQQAFNEGWPKDKLKKTKISSSIIPFKDGKPCKPVDGFLVSATALHKPNISDSCDINNYVDSLVTPALVIPKNPSRNILSQFAKKNAKVGDVVVTLVPGSSEPVYAVVGDTGPASELGEGSIALNGKLLGKTSEPISYLEVRGKKEFKGQAWTVPRAIVLIFPGSRDTTNPLMTPERINIIAKKYFDDWGGLDRINSCAKEYAQ